MSEKSIMTEGDIRRTIARIAHEIIERHRTAERLVLVGVHTRGVPLAHRLAYNIERFEGIKVPVGSLDIGPYRDDRNANATNNVVIHQTEIPVNVENKHVVLVDDVLFTGRSIRAAMDAVIDLGRPLSIELAVLIDRGHRELPIRPDYVGRNVPTARKEEIQVRMEEVDNTDEVSILTLDKITSANEGKG